MEKLSYKTLFTIVVVLLIGIVVLLRIQQKRTLVDAAWYNDSWAYRTSITVSNVGGTLTNSDVLIQLDTSSLISNSKMLSSCNDLRVTDADQTTLISYWIEGGCNTATTQLWVRVPSIPTGSKIIYIYYDNPGATNAEQSWSGNFTLLNAASCPTGWTRDTNFDSRFPYGGSGVGVTGGSSSHNHGHVSATTAALGDDGDAPSKAFGPNWISVSSSHNHSVGTSIATNASVLPPYLDMVFCSKSKLDISSGLIGLFNSTVPANWTRFTALDSKFPRGSATYGAIGGGSTHTHTFPGGETSSAASSSFMADTIGADADISSGSHTHITNSGTSAGGDNTPPYLDYIYGSINSNGVGTSTMVSLATANPPLGWTRVSTLDNKFPRGAASFGGSGGTSTHTHSVPITTNVTSDMAGYQSGGGAGNYLTHTHTATATTDSQSNIPPFYTVIYTQRNTPSATTSLGVEIVGGGAPVAWWKFNENVGTTTRDSGPNGFDGIIQTGGTSTTTPTWISGKSGSALDFDGLGNKFTKSGDSSLLRPTNNVSVEAWVYLKALPSELPGNRGVIIMKQHGAGSPWYSWDLEANYTSSENRFTFNWVNASGSNYSAYTRASTFTMTKNTWYHIVGIRNGAGMSVYVNGIDKTGGTSLPSAGDTNYASTSGIVIGSDGNTAAFKGTLDEIKVYDYARSASQIKTSYNSNSGVSVGQPSTGILTDGLVGWWKMDENTGTTVIDSSGGTNTVTFAAGSSAPNWSPSKFGVGLSFSGNDYASAPAIALNGNKGTISAWVNMSTIPSVGNYYSVFMRNYQAEGIDIQNDAGTVVAFFRVAGTTCSSSYSSPLAANTWYNIIGTYDGISQRVYINGVLSNTCSLTTSNWSSDASTWAISSMHGSDPSNFFYGVIDEVRLYRSYLSASEVQKLYRYAPGPIGYWKMEEASWTNNCSTLTALDSSGNNRSLRSCPAGTGPTGGSVGKVGKAGSFDGSDDYLETTDTSFNLADQITISAWVRRLSNPTNDVYIVDRTNGNFGYSFGLHNPPEPRLRIGNGASYTTITSSQSLALNTWYYLTATVDSSRNAKIYINGNLDTGATNITLQTATRDLRIGTRSAGNELNAQIDEVKIYNYPRTQSQIMEDMGSGKPLSPALNLKFEEYTSATAHDSSGNSFDATFGTGNSAPTWTTGRIGSAALFDGSNDEIKTPSNSSLDFTNDMTLEAWIYPTAGSGIILTRMDGAGGTSTGYEFHYDQTNQRIDLWRTGSNPVSNSNVITTNQWNHVVAVVANNVATFYVNGVARGGGAFTLASNGTSRVHIGSWSGSEAFAGKIDELKMYSYALTADEVKQAYNNSAVIQSGQTNQTIGATTTSLKYCVPGDTSPCNPPVANWRFEENSGTSVLDSSGNGYNGTLGSGTLRYAPGKVGGSFLTANADGVTDRIDVGDVAALDFTNSQSYTIGGWIRHIAKENWNYFIYYKGAEVNTSAGYNFGVNGGPYYECNYTDGNGSGMDSVASTTIANDTWHHVICVMDRTGTATGTVGFHMFVDGRLEASDTSLTEGDSTSAHSVQIGETDLNYEMAVGIDEFAVYNYARSTAQIAYDYNRGAPIGWWKLDECQGSTINNSAGIGYSGTISIGASGTNTAIGTCSGSAGQAWKDGSTGKYNSSIDLDGTDDNGSIPGLASYPFSSFTTSAWIKSTAGGTERIFSQQSGSYWLMGILGGQLSYHGSDDGAVLTAKGPLINDGLWHFVSIVRNLGNSTVTYYVDGKNVGSISSGSSTYTIASNVSIARHSGSDSQYYTGQLDDLRIYNYPLTSEQIKTVMNNGSANFR